MIKPKWTSGERFTVAHVPESPPSRATYLHVRAGQPLSVTDETPLGSIETTILGSPDSLLLLLAGERVPDVVVHGDERPLELLQQWILRAQSG
jgi:hypothetical protein